MESLLADYEREYDTFAKVVLLEISLLIANNGNLET